MERQLGEQLSADLDQICIPCVFGDAEIIIALLLLSQSISETATQTIMEKEAPTFFVPRPKTWPREAWSGVSKGEVRAQDTHGT